MVLCWRQILLGSITIRVYVVSTRGAGQLNSLGLVVYSATGSTLIWLSSDDLDCSTLNLA